MRFRNRLARVLLAFSFYRGFLEVPCFNVFSDLGTSHTLTTLV